MFRSLTHGLKFAAYGFNFVDFFDFDLSCESGAQLERMDGIIE